MASKSCPDENSLKPGKEDTGGKVALFPKEKQKNRIAPTLGLEENQEPLSRPIKLTLDSNSRKRNRYTLTVTVWS